MNSASSTAIKTDTSKVRPIDEVARRASQAGVAQGRTYQLAAYIFTLALFAALVGALGNWRNNPRAYWLNLCMIGWADGIWVLVVVLPGYVPLLRGLLPPAIFVLGAMLTTLARRNEKGLSATR